MRQYSVPALYDERPREFGGLLTLKQVGYLLGALMTGLPAVLHWPPLLGFAALGGCLLAGCGLAFGRWRGMPADRVLWMWVQYRQRRRRLVWRRSP